MAPASPEKQAAGTATDAPPSGESVRAHAAGPTAPARDESISRPAPVASRRARSRWPARPVSPAHRAECPNRHGSASPQRQHFVAGSAVAAAFLAGAPFFADAFLGAGVWGSCTITQRYGARDLPCESAHTPPRSGHGADFKEAVVDHVPRSRVGRDAAPFPCTESDSYGDPRGPVAGRGGLSSRGRVACLRGEGVHGAVADLSVAVLVEDRRGPEAVDEGVEVMRLEDDLRDGEDECAPPCS